MRWFQWFGGDEWQRPRPALCRQDVVVATAVVLLEAFCVVLIRSLADMGAARPPWVEYTCVAGLFPLLLLRRRWPLAVGVVAFAQFFASNTWVAEVGGQLSYQLAIFYLLYAATAWARDRRLAALVMGALTVALLLWLAWSFAVGQGITVYRRTVGQGAGGGLLPPVPAWVLFSFLINICFMVGAVWMGQAAWNQARDRALLASQAATIESQAAELSHRAVVDERLRIARELHDVVAHHVSVMGIQAAGARRLLERDPATAASALEHVEESARQAVTQMRSLLGALRGGDTAPDQGSRDPQPTLAEVGGLVREVREGGLDASLAVVENRPGASVALPLPVQLSLFRTVQEALANVRRHSTARHAAVTLRVDTDEQGRGWAEAEVLDDGHPIGNTSGSGLGLLGMRERVTSHGGSSEIGPRVTGGYRVRVRLPVGQPIGTEGSR